MSDQAAHEARQRDQLLQLWTAAIDAASIAGKYDGLLPPIPIGRAIVIGGGKGSAAMAREFDAVWPGELSGTVVTRHGFGFDDYNGRIKVIEAGHPVPDQGSTHAALRMIELVRSAGPDDVLIALVSGGLSALLTGLPEGVTLADKQDVTSQLLACGATITEMNLVRKHLSTVKGGKLAALAGDVPIYTYAVSDIPGDDIGAIGSGPTIPDHSTVQQARAVLQKYAIALPASLQRHLDRSEAAERPGQALTRPQDNACLVAAPKASLDAAAKVARELGYEPVILGDDLEGEARDLGRAHAALALDRLKLGQRVCLLSGGETTVTLRGTDGRGTGGRGGRNSEYLLAIVETLQGQAGIAAIAADTDGIDGSEDNAGALGFASTIGRAGMAGVDAAQCLAVNDSYGFFAAIGDLLVTGPTHTNVNDFRAILIDPALA